MTRLAERLNAWLRTKDRFRANLWWDRASILPGSDWQMEVRRTLETADVALLCFGKQWNPERKGFFDEEMYFLSQPPHRHVIPVLLDGVPPG